jgi:hypothetical protein
MVMHHVREALYDIRPSPARLKPFMYWNSAKPTACAKLLLRRTPALRLVAEKYRRNEFAGMMIADGVQFPANNEKSTQIRMVKLLFLNDKSDFTMISKYQICASSNGTLQEMRIAKTLTNEFESIEELRNALSSPNMYIYPKVFNLFCAALESGRLRGAPAMGISPIEDLITVPHEAHF